MSTRNIYDDDDECDSSFVYRNRQAIIFKNDSTIKQEVNIDEPLNLSLKPRIHDKSAINVKEEVRELNKENENDLTELGWLTSYNIKKDLNINNFGNLSPEYGVDDEADSGGRALNSCIPASLLQNMLAPHSKPPYSYSCLIFMSIESSIRKRLTVKEIYSWVLSNFPYFSNIPSGSWKNSIRHNLSHNKCFKKVDKNLLACRDFSGKGSLWCVNPEYRMVLIETMKKTPQKAFSILQDIPESMGLHIYKTPSLVASRSVPKITNTSAIQNIRKENDTRSIKLSSSIDSIRLNDFYKKASKESLSDCSDYDAANALLMFKSSTNDQQPQTSRSVNMKKRTLSHEFLTKKRSSSDKKNSIKKKSKSNIDHCYSNELSNNKQEIKVDQTKKKEEPIQNTPTKRKCRKKSEPVKVENVDEINNFSDSYSFNSDSLDFNDTNTTCSNGSDSDRRSTVSADTLRNALLELSRAAELVEDKDDI